MSLASLNARIAAAEADETRLPLTPQQSAAASRLFAAGQNHYGEAPVMFGQLRKNIYPEPPGYHLAIIAVRQSTAKKVSTLLDKELIREEERQGYIRPKPEPPRETLVLEDDPADKRRVEKVRNR